MTGRNRDPRADGSAKKVSNNIRHGRSSVQNQAADDENSDEVAKAEQEPAERVGYGRPPEATRFRPGQSGNPRGRPKGSRNLATIVNTALGEGVPVNENGRRKRISKMEAMVKQLVNRAAAGEIRSTQLLLALIQTQEAVKRADAATAAPEKISEADAFVMEELARRMRGATKK